jgi:hypothetical protein
MAPASSPLRCVLLLVVIALAAATATAAEGKKHKKGAKKKPPTPAPAATTKAFDKITCVITGGPEGKRHEEITLTGDLKYELRSSADAAPKTGNVTQGQIEMLRKRLNAVSWRGLKEKYNGGADACYAALTVVVDGKPHRTTVPIDVALLPDMKSEVPEPVNALVDELTGIYKRYIDVNKKPGKPKQGKGK